MACWSRVNQKAHSTIDDDNYGDNERILNVIFRLFDLYHKSRHNETAVFFIIHLQRLQMEERNRQTSQML